MADSYVSVKVFVSGLLAAISIIVSVMGSMLWRLDSRIESMETRIIEFMLSTPTRRDVWTRSEQELYSRAVERRLQALERKK